MKTMHTLLLLALVSQPLHSEIRRDPNGVNVNFKGATTIFISFGGLDGQIPVEATWCGALIPAAPDIGSKCDPSTLFGQLPIRFDQSSQTGSSFTDIMSIPPSVSRRAYQAATSGDASQFFYVRRFQSLVGGPDEYVFVTCRLAGGGARVPLSLLKVRVAFEVDIPVTTVFRGQAPPTLSAEIVYNGTGRLKGRWEVVRPGEDPPSSRDLLTEASLPEDKRPLQRRYTLLDRFNVFLPPTGTVTLPGPDPELLPSDTDGLYLVLLRIEATADKEGDSNLAKVGEGQGIVHSAGVAGFPMPALRYFVGSAEGAMAAYAEGELTLVAPPIDHEGWGSGPLRFSWTDARSAQLYRLEILGSDGSEVHAAILQKGISTYLAPSFLSDLAGAELSWRVSALGPKGEELATTDRRALGAP